MSVCHVLLKEFHSEKQIPYFLDYQKKYTDAPFVVELVKQGEIYRPGRMVRANVLGKYHAEEHGEWKFLMWDTTTNSFKMPMGMMGHRWQAKKGQWNLLLKDGVDGSEIDPALSLVGNNDEVTLVEFLDFGNDKKAMRGVPAKRMKTAKGEILVATIYDLLMGQHGVDRGLSGDYPKSYDDQTSSYTPAWQEKFTGIGRETVIRFAREWGKTAEKTNGKCCVIIGAGIDHWYHNNLIYRAATNALIFAGCVGKNGGGLNHYVGQEKLAPGEPWSAIALLKTASLRL